VALTVRDPPRREHERAGRRSPCREPVLWRIHAASSLLVVPQFTVATFAPAFLVDSRGWHAAEAGRVLAAAALCAAAARLGAGFWSDLAGRRMRPMRSLAVATGLVNTVQNAFAAATPPVIAAVIGRPGTRRCSPWWRRSRCWPRRWSRWRPSVRPDCPVQLRPARAGPDWDNGPTPAKGRQMDVYEALYTTRAMRRVRPDPIPYPVQARILDAAIRAPSGGNAQGWRFILVDDPAVKAELGPLYRDSIAQLWATVYRDLIEAASGAPEEPAHRSTLRMVASAQHLADHFEEVPLFLLAFSRGDISGGSIYPAVWSAQLAARAEGVGSALTTVLGFFHGPEASEILGVPEGHGWTMACCVSFGYPTGRWGVAGRRPVPEIAYRNAWGEDLGLDIPGPLWPPEGA
jgi:nitroreductase